MDHSELIHIAYMLSWSEYPEHRADLANVWPLSKTHHAVFDRELFMIDQECRLHVNPAFETQSDVLQRTIIEQAGERVLVSDESLDPKYVEQRNSAIKWV